MDVKCIECDGTGKYEKQVDCPVCQADDYECCGGNHCCDQCHQDDGDNYCERCDDTGWVYEAANCQFCRYGYTQVDLGVKQLAGRMVKGNKVIRTPFGPMPEALAAIIDDIDYNNIQEDEAFAVWCYRHWGGAKLTFERVFSRPDMGTWGRAARHYKFTIENNGEVWEEYYSQGGGHPVGPNHLKAGDLFGCLGTDISCFVNARDYDDFAADMGDGEAEFVEDESDDSGYYDEETGDWVEYEDYEPAEPVRTRTGELWLACQKTYEAIIRLFGQTAADELAQVRY
jgi:hypothetical protein